MPVDDSRHSVVALGWVSFLTDVSSEMIYPLLPSFLTKTLGAGPAAVGLIEGIAETTASLTKIGSGVWSDRVRRRKPLVILGYTIAAVARPLIAFARVWTTVLAIRFTDRLGKGIRTSPRDALIADIVPAERRGRSFGLQRAMDNAGALVGPLLAALFVKLAIEERTIFLLAAVPGFAAVLVLLLAVPEARRRIETPPAIAPEPGAEPLPPRFWRLLAVFSLFTLANSTDAFLLLRAEQAGVALWQLPLLWSFFHAVKAVTGIPGGAVADRAGRTTAIALGWLVYAASYAGFAFVSRPLAVWGLFALYGVFFGLTEGAERAFVADLVPERLRGRAFGFFHAAVGISALPASLLFGLVWKSFGPSAAFSVGASIALLATLALWLATRSIRADASPRAGPPVAAARA